MPSTDDITPVKDILVVDDNTANILAVEAALSDFVSRIVKAHSGEEALRYLLREDFAVILLDVQMPNMNGFETARLIRARKSTRHVPIIFMTAFDHDEQEILRGYSLGAVDFLFKPIISEVLRAKVSVFVELKRRAEEIARQAELLREHQQREHQQRLEEERRQWEADMLRRQMAEEQKRAADVARINQQLREADRRKDEFIAMLAHELRNPLSPIVMGIELMESCDLTDPLLKRAHSAMRRQAMHLRRLVDDLLDISRITSGKIEIRKEWVELSSVIQQAVETVRPEILQNNHQLTVTLPDRSVKLSADSVRLTQVLANLLHNSARYTDPGGNIRLSAEIEGTQIVVRITDNGQGIDSEHIERIFDMFVQKRRGGPGLGLGLTLVKQLVEMHGGTVTAHSEGPGKGSQFVVRLPLGNATAVAQPSEEAQPAPAAARAPMRIVIIDDNEDIRRMLSAILERSGHRVETADNGFDGVELVLRESPDVVLVDIGMPEMDGYEVAKQVREKLPTGKPRLVALTGFGQQQDRDRAFAAGFNAHLVKPATQERLLQILTEE